MKGVLIGPFWPDGLRFERAILIDGADQMPLGPSTPCLAVVDACRLIVPEQCRLPPATRTVDDAWLLFETEPPSAYKLALGLCAFREDGSSEIGAGDTVTIGGES